MELDALYMSREDELYAALQDLVDFFDVEVIAGAMGPDELAVLEDKLANAREALEADSGSDEPNLEDSD